MSIEEIMDELIREAESEPAWKAVSALRTAKKELIKMHDEEVEKAFQDGIDAGSEAQWASEHV